MKQQPSRCAAHWPLCASTSPKQVHTTVCFCTFWYNCCAAFAAGGGAKHFPEAGVHHCLFVLCATASFVGCACAALILATVRKHFPEAAAHAPGLARPLIGSRPPQSVIPRMLAWLGLLRLPSLLEPLSTAQQAEWVARPPIYCC